MSIINSKKTVGRPRKFEEPSRPVTVTLPASVLRKLALLNEDRARAIAQAVEGAVADETAATCPLQLVEVFKNQSLITISDCPALDCVTWLRRVKIAPGRYLLAIPPGMPTESLEVALVDLLDEKQRLSDTEFEVIRRLRECLAFNRRRNRMVKGELIFITSGEG